MNKQSEVARMGAQVALRWGLIHHDASLMRAALSAGADASAEDAQSALRQAVGRDWRAGVEMAIKAGASPDAQSQGRSLLERAVAKRASRCVRFLLPLASERGLSLARAALGAMEKDEDPLIERLVLKEIARREATEIEAQTAVALTGQGVAGQRGAAPRL